jgi:hypothetical protein
MITSWLKDIAHRISQLADLLDPSRPEKRYRMEMKYFDVCSELEEQQKELRKAKIDADWYEENYKIAIGAVNWNIMGIK